MQEELLSGSPEKLGHLYLQQVPQGLPLENGYQEILCCTGSHLLRKGLDF